jgi:hypothetical protein
MSGVTLHTFLTTFVGAGQRLAHATRCGLAVL